MRTAPRSNNQRPFKTMKTILVTGSDTGVGKTHVVAALARILAWYGNRVQIIKVIETGRPEGGLDTGDAERAREMAGVEARACTWESFAAPLSPAIAAEKEGRRVSVERLASRVADIPPCDWAILEGAGGIATPLDEDGRDWADFGRAVGADHVVVVVPDRLGAINQARLSYGRARETGLRAGIWFNAPEPVDPAVTESNRTVLTQLGIPIWADQRFEALLPDRPEEVMALFTLWAENGAPNRIPSAPEPQPAGPERDRVIQRCREKLKARERQNLKRTLRVTPRHGGWLNLADNDYLELAQDSAVLDAAAAAVKRHGTSASASPLITGWGEIHQELIETLGRWHGFQSGLLWSSGFAANSALLGVLPGPGDVVLADRLIHHSMIAGILRSGARLVRYDHLRLDRLERHLAEKSGDAGAVFVVTESVFSMDGDYPDLVAMAELKRRFGFCWMVDEAHGLGWYGAKGAGLVRAAGVEHSVDILVGTLGKALASGGAYSLFHDDALRDSLVNEAGEFIYSTALPPANAAAALAAVGRLEALSPGQGEWQQTSRWFRRTLQDEGWSVPDGDSPIVPVRLDDPEAALSVAEALRQQRILAGAVRPPTVPKGTSRLRFSLKRSFSRADGERVLRVLASWRADR
jgi:8-amino-7-oxononanoate synthase